VLVHVPGDAREHAAARRHGRFHDQRDPSWPPFLECHLRDPMYVRGAPHVCTDCGRFAATPKNTRKTSGPGHSGATRFPTTEVRKANTPPYPAREAWGGVVPLRTNGQCEPKRTNENFARLLRRNLNVARPPAAERITRKGQSPKLAAASARASAT
jgi:hypothetical protein